MVDMPRVLVYDRLDQYLCDIDPQQVLEMPYTEAINGEHSLTIRTTQKLEKTNRLLLQDGTGEWHEYVVLGIDDTHDESEYYCVWSLEYDLSGTFINGPYDCGVVPGHASVPQLPRRALEVSLGDTTRWVIGTITVTTMSAASFYRRSGWEGLQTVIERWGGELHATIGVDSTGVISRAVDLLAHEGTEEPTRRFDYGHDVTGITRTISDEIWPCRIVPLGKSSETEAGGYTRRPSIESVNGGILWLQDDDAVPLVRVMNPQGEWEYPTSIIRNDTYEDPAALKEWALENISDYTRPKVSYTATVAQFARAGLNPHGVRLGDEIIVVDRKFRDEGLRISARVLKIKGDLLDASKTQLTIGNATETLGSQLKGIVSQVDTMAEETARTTEWETTAGYLSNLLGRLNTEANMTGGYTYITQGEGLRTYDTPVSDPLVGTEASKVVEIKGGNIRIADSRTQAGDWDWKTVLVSGHIAADLVTAARLTAGYIGNASGGSYWDLDNDVLHIGTGAQVGNVTAGDLATQTDVEDAKKVATSYLDFDAAVGLDIGYAGTQAKTRISSEAIELFDGDGTSVAYFGDDGTGTGTHIARLGATGAASRMVASTAGFIDLIYNTYTLAHFGYGDTIGASGSTVKSQYYTLGTRLSTAQIGSGSFVEGLSNSAAGYVSHAGGVNSSASGGTSFAFGANAAADGDYSFAFGYQAKAYGDYSVAMGEQVNTGASAPHAISMGNRSHATGSNSVAIGYNNTASGDGSVAIGYNNTASGANQTSIGRGAVGNTSHLLSIGYYSNGSSGSTGNIGYFTKTGNLWIKGTLTQGSDRRLKEHIAYLGEDAASFIRGLRPAIYSKDGGRHLGFYAQDVQEAEPEGWDTETVVADTDNTLYDFDVLSLDYTALIAPLVAYAQQLERRIEKLEKEKEEA